MTVNCSIKRNTYNIDGEKFPRLEFLDICAAFGERLEHWRSHKRAEGLPEKRIRASLAIDIKPRDGLVCQKDMLVFLSAAPDRSIREINAEYINDCQHRYRKESDPSHVSLTLIAKEISRVMLKDGKFYLTMPLRYDSDLRAILESEGFKVEPIAFGYVGFLGGSNSRFPAEGLPAVEPIGYFTRQHLELVKFREEGGDPLAAVFAEKIGTHAYIGENPVRYLAVLKS